MYSNTSLQIWQRLEEDRSPYRHPECDSSRSVLLFRPTEQKSHSPQIRSFAKKQSQTTQETQPEETGSTPAEPSETVAGRKRKSGNQQQVTTKKARGSTAQAPWGHTDSFLYNPSLFTKSVVDHPEVVGKCCPGHEGGQVPYSFMNQTNSFVLLNCNTNRTNCFREQKNILMISCINSELALPL